MSDSSNVKTQRNVHRYKNKQNKKKDTWPSQRKEGILYSLKHCKCMSFFSESFQNYPKDAWSATRN